MTLQSCTQCKAPLKPYWLKNGVCPGCRNPETIIISVANTAKYPIGTQYLTRGKNPKLCTVMDILKTYNSAGELVSTRYVSQHVFLGQVVTNNDVVETTIAMGLIA